MKKGGWIIGMVLAGVIFLSSCGITIQTGESMAPSSEAVSSQAPIITTAQPIEPSSSPAVSFLTEEQVKDLVLSHAGVSREDAVFTDFELDRDDGKVYYEVEFHIGKVEYQYDIDATTGGILSYEIENHSF